jgi:hypothetical protein
MPTWPFFRETSSRYAMKNLLPVPVKSCWNGMGMISPFDLHIQILTDVDVVAMPVAPFLANPPLRFRGISDSLASSYLEGSECCLIHADNPLSAHHGVYLNPLVRVAYSTAAYVAVNPTLNWLSPKTILQGLWLNRIRRWTTFPRFKERMIHNRIARWTSLSPGNTEPGEFCVINEMQVLDPRGWYHV